MLAHRCIDVGILWVPMMTLEVPGGGRVETALPLLFSSLLTPGAHPSPEQLERMQSSQSGDTGGNSLPAIDSFVTWAQPLASLSYSSML